MAQRPLAGDAKGAAQQVATQAANNSWVRGAARLGYAAIGLVYILIGVLAVRTAFGASGETSPDQQTALQRILEAPFGRLILGLVALGLFGYLIWRLLEAGLDVEGKGNNPKGLARRAGYALNGLIYGALGLQALRLAMGAGSGEGNNQQQEWTARFMQLPLGRWLVGLAGLVIIGVGCYELYEGWTRKFRKRLAYDQLSEAERGWADRVGVAGKLAHGVVLALIGAFFVQAALRFDPAQAGGLGRALGELAAQPYGPLLLGVVSVGLLAYGIFKLFEARYHRVLAR